MNLESLAVSGDRILDRRIRDASNYCDSGHLFRMTSGIARLVLSELSPIDLDGHSSALYFRFWLAFENDFNRMSSSVAGLSMSRPSSPNRDPWQGQSQLCSWALYFRAQPIWGQCADLRQKFLLTRKKIAGILTDFKIF